MSSLKKLAALLGVGALVFAMAGTALAGGVDYATVSGHEAHSKDANSPDYWGDNCTKINNGEGDLSDQDTYVLGSNYGKVIVKAGANQEGNYANTIYDNPTAGQTVWADSNGSFAFDEGDKQISHIIFCDEEAEPTPTFNQSQEGETDPASEPNTASIGGTRTSGPADGAWLLVVALGVLLASIVVLTPARAKSRR